jgi:hypothetical protein
MTARIASKEYSDMASRDEVLNARFPLRKVFDNFPAIRQVSEFPRPF